MVCNLFAVFLHFIPPKKGLHISNANNTQQQRKNTTRTDGDNDT